MKEFCPTIIIPAFLCDLLWLTLKISWLSWFYEICGGVAWKRFVGLGWSLQIWKQPFEQHLNSKIQNCSPGNPAEQLPNPKGIWTVNGLQFQLHGRSCILTVISSCPTHLIAQSGKIPMSSSDLFWAHFHVKYSNGQLSPGEKPN